LIEQLLQFSKLEEGTLKLRVSEQDVLAVVRRTISYFTSPAAKKQVELQFNSPDAEITGYIDGEKLDHIIQNLLSNALKFTPAGGIITVEVLQEDSDCVCHVRDTGTGILPEHLPHIFERFYRADNTHTTEGTGIGLSLTKELVEIHQGTIDVQSTAGKGTVVTVRIPLSGYDKEEIVTHLTDAEQLPVRSIPEFESSSSPDAPVKNGKPVILIAEDNDDTRRFIAIQLSKEFTIVETVDGKEALLQSRTVVPDLVISDVMMPNLNGNELCKELKSDERTSHIPVILLTALADRENKLEGLETGADDYLIKPFDAAELLARIHNLLQNRKSLRESFSKGVLLKPGEIAARSLDDLFLQKGVEVVTAHLSEENFNVEHFAHEMFFSRTQLQRKLKAITNLSPSEFIRHLRMERAKELLEKRTGTVAEIAERVGFSNLSYFSKCYKEHFGHSPSEE
jgi:DNA-binding response OmpR family regulator/anti-sigma regulatory factor (Ser/Thr protein kinase)